MPYTSSLHDQVMIPDLQIPCVMKICKKTWCASHYYPLHSLQINTFNQYFCLVFIVYYLNSLILWEAFIWEEILHRRYMRICFQKMKSWTKLIFLTLLENVLVVSFSLSKLHFMLTRKITLPVRWEKSTWFYFKTTTKTLMCNENVFWQCSVLLQQTLNKNQSENHSDSNFHHPKQLCRVQSVT